MRKYLHDDIQLEVYNKPNIIGVDQTELLIKSMETGLYTHGRLVVTPDVYFQTLYENIYVEVKQSRSHQCMRKGKDQLERILLWHDMHGLPTPKLYLVTPKDKYYKNWKSLVKGLIVQEYKF